MSAHLPVRPYAELGEIPPVVHQIWVGKPHPPWVGKLWAEWDEYAAEHGLTMRRWGNDDLPKTMTGRLSRKYPFMPPVQIADLLRIEAVSLYGGLYMDSDTLPLQSLAPWVGDRAAWLGQGPQTGSKEFFNNATFGFPAAHPYLAAVWDHANGALRRGLKSTFNVAGPTAYRNVLDGDRDGYHVEIPRGPFISKSRADKREERKLGRPFTPAELRQRYPDAAVAHLSMVSWVATNTWNVGYREKVWGST